MFFLNTSLLPAGEVKKTRTRLQTAETYERGAEPRRLLLAGMLAAGRQHLPAGGRRAGGTAGLRPSGIRRRDPQHQASQSRAPSSGW